MRYSKPELLAAEAALEAIRGVGKFDSASETDNERVSIPAYEVDE